MISLTELERKALIILVKDYTIMYNANSLSKVLGISHVGAQKMLKRFKDQDLTYTKNIGRSIIHKPNLKDDYNQKLISFLLTDEANNFKRWKEEFKELFKDGRIILLYGSSIKDYKHANDIDIMVMLNQKDTDEVNKKISKIDEMLPKKIHALKLTKQDLTNNIKDNNKTIIDIIRNAIVIYGQDQYVGVIKNVTII